MEILLFIYISFHHSMKHEAASAEAFFSHFNFLLIYFFLLSRKRSKELSSLALLKESRKKQKRESRKENK
jgi:hypothetical protein